MAFSVTPLPECSSTPQAPLVIPLNGAGGANVTVSAQTPTVDYSKWFQAILIGIILLGAVQVISKKRKR